MGSSVESFCHLLIRSQLLSSGDVKSLHQRWRKEAGDGVFDIDRFTRWLMANQVVTDYQVGLLNRGQTDNFFLKDYKILDRIGKGRMAGVYQAVHKLGQVVAIKVLPPSKAKEPKVLARFQRESRLAMKFNHPNVVRTFQAGESNGLYFLVMEYLEGETLEEMLKHRGKLQPAEAVHLVYQALMGLQHVHERNVVHRDLKPANLMVVSAERGNRDSVQKVTVKILDIGLGRGLFDEDPSGDEENYQLTNEGAILGTPDYIAPEQARDAHGSDIRADIYSLGCVLYHALTGQPPFADPNLLRQMIRHATEAPRPLREFNPAVPEGLQQISDWMLAKDPAKRYPTPERAALALKVFLESSAEVSASVEQKSKMNTYLQWLNSQTVEEKQEIVSAVQKKSVPSSNVAKKLAPARQRKLSEGANVKVAPKLPVARLVSEKVADSVLTADVELVSPPSREEARGWVVESVGLRLDRRDLILLGTGASIGAGILLAAEGILYLVFRFF